MDSTKRVFKFQNYDWIKSVVSFWLVIILVNIFTTGSTWYSGAEMTLGPSIHNGGLLSMAGVNIMFIFIYFLAYGINIYHEGFTLALSFGATRRDFYKSALVSSLLLVMIFAVIQGVLQVIDKNVIESLGFNPMVDFRIFNTSRDSLFIIVPSLFGLFLICSSMSSLLGVLQYKFGYKLWIGLGIIAVIGTLEKNYLIRSLLKGFSRIYLWLEPTFSSLTILPIGIGIMLISYTLGYLLIRRINIKK